MKAAIYLRVSTNKQTVENQRPELAQFVAARPGWEPVWFEETGSGGDTERPVWAKVMDAAHRGQVGAVVVWRLDRCTRSLSHLLQVVEQLDKAGVEFHSVREPIVSQQGTFRPVVLALLGAVAQMEKEAISERTAAAARRAKALGKGWGRKRVDPEKLEQARQLLAQGVPLERAALEAGIKPPTLRRYVKDAKGVANG